MVEVDPMLLIAAGSIAAGLAAAALCLRAPSKSVEKKTISNKKTEQVATVKPKKKAAKVTKKVVTAAANDSAAESDASEIAAIIADIGSVDVQHKSTKKAKEAAKSSGPSAVEIAATKKKAAEAAEVAAKAAQKAEAAKEAAELQARLLAEEEEAKKSKKAKETPEQRVARLDRQRLAKVKKVEEEELSKSAAIQLAAVESKLVATASNSSASTQASHVDGWAVVEDKRKVKAKALPPAAVAAESAPSEPTGPVDFVKAEISVESKKIGIIIGPKGVTLHGIQDATGVEINTPKGERDNTSPIIITVSGSADGVARASKAIQELCSKGYTKLLAGEDFKEGSMDVHPTYLSEIIGKGGANIRAIQDFTGVKLSIPQVARDHNMNVKITVAGNKDKVQAAKDIITELMKYYHTSVTHPGYVHAEMDVPSALYNYIIGARGSEIKHIQANFKVAVHIPNADSVSNNVIIVGDSVGVKNAEKYIQKIIDQAVADKEAAEKMADAWVDTDAEEGHEEWMNEYTHPSSRQTDTAQGLTVSAPAVGLSGEGGFKLGAASSAAGAASASAWGASVLASADGW